MGLRSLAGYGIIGSLGVEGFVLSLAQIPKYFKRVMRKLFCIYTTMRKNFHIVIVSSCISIRECYVV
jgi:hypothetical protein